MRKQASAEIIHSGRVSEYKIMFSFGLTPLYKD